MAVTKLWSVHSDVAGVADYDINPLKTTYDEEIMPRGITVTENVVEPDNGLLVSGINCSPFTAIEEFMEVKKKFEKFDGILAYHGYISFPGIDGLDPVNVLSIAKEMAQEMWGEKFQVLLSVHTNTDTLHCHLLVNSVSFVDGHKAVHNEKNYYRFKNIVDDICRFYGLTVPVPYSRADIEYPDLEEKLIKIRMGSFDLQSLKENLAKEDIKYCGKKYIRVKDGRYVRLTMIAPNFDGLFEFDKSETTVASSKKESNPVHSGENKDVERFIGRS